MYDTEYRCQCHCVDSIQATTCLLTNEVRLAPVSNRVGTGSDEELLLVKMQHVRYVVSMSVPLQSHVVCYKEYKRLPGGPSNYVPIDK